MTNIQYLKEHNLYNAHQQFRRLTESYFVPMEEDSFYEEDEDPSAGGEDPNAMGGDPNAMGGDPNAMGGDPNAMGGDPMGGDPNAMGGDPNAMGGDPNAMGGDPNAMGGDPNAMGGDPMGGDPNAMGGDPMMDDPDAMGDDLEDDDTIDIDDLTKAQVKLDIKQNHVGRDLSKVDTKLNAVMDAVSKLEKMIDAHNHEIENFKSEFEKRNPTQTEKLNLRFMDSYPFNVKANEYFNNLPKDSNYSAYGDNKTPMAQEDFKITNNDVDDYQSDIADTFFNIDDDDIQTFDKIFK